MSVFHFTPNFPPGTPISQVLEYYCFFDSEFPLLMEDLGLVSSFSNEFEFVRSSPPVDFEDDLRSMASREDPSSQVYENLCEVYAKYNRKGSRRTFGSSFDLQLTLDL